MNYGKMNKRVTLQRRDETQDTMGQTIETWVDQAESFAKVEPVSGREFFQASGQKSEVTHKVTMRARDDFALAPRDRLVYKTRTFNISSVLDEEEDGRLWLLMCSEALDVRA